jgi:hypothetical protein
MQAPAPFKASIVFFANHLNLIFMLSYTVEMFCEKLSRLLFEKMEGIAWPDDQFFVQKRGCTGLIRASSHIM